MNQPTSVEVDQDALSHSFERLADVVSAISHEGKRPTAAGVKSAMLAQDAGFSERAFGFRQFILYLRAAEQRGLVWIAYDELGHPRISDVPIVDSPPPLVEQARVPATTHEPAVKIRSDLWFATIPWASNVLRLWDRASSRALVIPTDQSGRPLWETRSDRFVAIDPVPKETQLEWMREFARTQPPSQESDILEALSDSAAPGAFKRVLQKLTLEESWTQVLQARAAEHLQSWAEENTVPAARLFDKRPQRGGHPKVAPAFTPTISAASSGADRPAADAVRASAPPESYEDRLRSRMHLVIDRMSVAELSALNVPAAYLLAD